MTGGDRHRCPAKGCPNLVAERRVACLYHWYGLPVPMRAAILRGFHRSPGGPAHLGAIADAVRYWRDVAGSPS